jgi:hypothetical protein
MSFSVANSQQCDDWSSSVFKILESEQQVEDAVNKCFPFTSNDHFAMSRFRQGFIHARAGRDDLVGLCEHYDQGFEYFASL